MRRLSRDGRLRASKVVETFLAEAAVLLAVFPILDEFIQHGRQGVTWQVVATSAALAIVFLGTAVGIAIRAEEE